MIQKKKKKSKTFIASTCLHICGTEAKFNEGDRHLCRKKQPRCFYLMWDFE